MTQDGVYPVFLFRVTSTSGLKVKTRYIECAHVSVQSAHAYVTEYLKNQYSTPRYEHIPNIAPGLETGKKHSRVCVLSDRVHSIKDM